MSNSLFIKLLRHSIWYKDNSVDKYLKLSKSICVKKKGAFKKQTRVLIRQNRKNAVSIDYSVYKEYHWKALRMNLALRRSNFSVTRPDLQ